MKAKNIGLLLGLKLAETLQNRSLIMEGSRKSTHKRTTRFLAWKRSNLGAKTYAQYVICLDLIQIREIINKNTKK